MPSCSNEGRNDNGIFQRSRGWELRDRRGKAVSEGENSGTDELFAKVQGKGFKS